jgi:hypothetical protein
MADTRRVQCDSGEDRGHGVLANAKMNSIWSHRARHSRGIRKVRGTSPHNTGLCQRLEHMAVRRPRRGWRR